jgi:hypothetical protein
LIWERDKTLQAHQLYALGLDHRERKSIPLNPVLQTVYGDLEAVFNGMFDPGSVENSDIINIH